MTITLKVTGINEVIAQLKELDEIKIGLGIRAGLDESAKEALRQLKENTPVDTGNLRDSETITVPSADTRLIAPNATSAPYGPFVEFGHHTKSGSFVSGQFFVEQTAIEIIPRFADIMLRNLEKEIKF